MIAGQAFDMLHSYLNSQQIMEMEKVSIRLGMLKDFELLTVKDCGFTAVP